MHLEKAKHTRDKYKNLIGQKAKDFNANIIDVLVVPIDNFSGFISEFRMYKDDISNDEMLMKYPSTKYAVKVIYDIDPYLVNIYLDDIDVYITHN